MHSLPLLVLNLLLLSPGFRLKQEKLSLSDGTRLSYTLALPAGTRKAASLPLVVGLHWGWNTNGPAPAGTGRDFAEQLLLPALEGEQVLVVAPDCPGQDWTGPGSEEAILEMVRAVRERYPVDSNRIFLAGFSLGGVGSWYLGYRHPRLFTAIIPMASLPEPLWVKDWGLLPVYAIQGTADQVFPFETAADFIRQLSEKKLDARLHSLPGASHYDTRRYIRALRNAWDHLRE